MFNDRLVPLPLKVANTLGLILVLAANALANILPINGLNTGEVSDFYPNLFTPAGVTFSIWGIIYFFLILFVVYNYNVVGKKSDKKIMESIGWYFFISCILNVAWLLLWHYLYIGYSLIVMVLLLLVLLRIYFTVHGNMYSDPNNRIFVRVPFSIYAGWITVATIANVTAFLVHLQWSGWGLPPQIWTLIMMAVATAIMSLVVYRFHDAVYGLVLIWTLAGIGWKHLEVFAMEYPFVVYGSVVFGLLMIGTIIASEWTRRKRERRLF